MSEGESEAPMRVLIVDDVVDILEMLGMACERAGMEVVGLAVNGIEALQMAEEQQPDVILLDMAMPRMGGLEALPEFENIAPQSKVVVHSAIGAMHMTDAALEAGAFGYIEKGVSPSSIIAHLQRVAAAGRKRPVRPYPLKRDYQI